VPLLEALEETTPTRLQGRLLDAESHLRSGGEGQSLNFLEKDHNRTQEFGEARAAVLFPSAFVVRPAGVPATSPCLGLALRHRISSLFAALASGKAQPTPRSHSLAPMPYYEALSMGRCIQIRYAVAWFQAHRPRQWTSWIEGGDISHRTSSRLVLQTRGGHPSVTKELDWSFDPAWTTTTQVQEIADAADPQGADTAALPSLRNLASMGGPPMLKLH
jgi:hypothetical protein